MIRASCVIILLSVLGGSSKTAQADTATKVIDWLDPKLFGETRLRVEHTRQDDLPDDATALTQVFRLGVEAKLLPRLTTLVEGEGVAAIVDDFNDGSGINPTRPVILDVEGLELNRLQLQAQITDQTTLTVGRQLLSIDDARFIGPAAFRQNRQTFDGIHFAARLKQGTTFQAGYFNQVNRPLGNDNPVGRFEGDSYYFNANVETPIGRIGAFHYALDLETGPEDAMDNTSSSQTSGFRLDGRLHADTYGVDWEAGYARQKDFADNPIDYAADYWVAGLQAFIGPAKLGFRAESLGAGDGQSFQTPLANLHRHNGEADIFLVTPSQGLVDLEVSAIWDIGTIGAFRAITASARHHWFNAESNGADLGTELNLRLQTNIEGFQFAVIYADYDADMFAADTQRLFFSMSKRF